jgi:hypothetical protein
VINRFSERALARPRVEEMIEHRWLCMIGAVRGRATVRRLRSRGLHRQAAALCRGPLAVRCPAAASEAALTTVETGEKAPH